MMAVQNFAAGSEMEGHWGRDKIDAILQTTFIRASSWIETYAFWLKCHWSLFLRVQLPIVQHWFRLWLGDGIATSYYLNLYWLDNWRIYASLGLNELIIMNQELHQEKEHCNSTSTERFRGNRVEINRLLCWVRSIHTRQSIVCIMSQCKFGIWIKYCKYCHAAEKLSATLTVSDYDSPFEFHKFCRLRKLTANDILHDYSLTWISEG